MGTNTNRNDTELEIEIFEGIKIAIQNGTNKFYYNKLIMNFDLSKIEETLKTTTGSAKGRALAEMPRDQCMQAVTMVMESKSLDTPENAMVIITGLVQNGGSNRNATASVTYTFKGKTLSAMEFQTIITKVNKTALLANFVELCGMKFTRLQTYLVKKVI